MSAILMASTMMVGASTVQAGIYNWPSYCDNANWAYNPKVAARLFKDVNHSGTKEVECGSWASAVQQRFYDEHFGTSNRGEIDDLNDKVSSLMLYNRHDSYGVCFVFYESAGFYGVFPRWSWWVGAKPSGSNFRWKSISFTHNPDFDPSLALMDSFSSARAIQQGTSGIYDAQDCHQQQRQYYISTSADIHGGVTWP